jgi:hypothetical protein
MHLPDYLKSGAVGIGQAWRSCVVVWPADVDSIDICRRAVASGRSKEMKSLPRRGRPDSLYLSFLSDQNRESR